MIRGVMVTNQSFIDRSSDDSEEFELYENKLKRPKFLRRRPSLDGDILLAEPIAKRKSHILSIPANNPSWRKQLPVQINNILPVGNNTAEFLDRPKVYKGRV